MKKKSTSREITETEAPFIIVGRGEVIDAATEHPKLSELGVERAVRALKNGTLRAPEGTIGTLQKTRDYLDLWWRVVRGVPKPQ